MGKPAKKFEDLIVWQKAQQFVLAVYAITRSFPKEEMYGLTSQFRRAAISIAANIGEGFKKRGKKDKARFLNIAHASLEECRYYVNMKELFDDIDEISKLLSAYRSAILNSNF